MSLFEARLTDTHASLSKDIANTHASLSKDITDTHASLSKDITDTHASLSKDIRDNFKWTIGLMIPVWFGILAAIAVELIKG